MKHEIARARAYFHRRSLDSWPPQLPGLLCASALRLAFRQVDDKVESVRVLVIEDEVKLATHLSRALEAEGHEARVVHDGKVALVEARDGKYDLLLLDVELPRMDGF